MPTEAYALYPVVPHLSLERLYFNAVFPSHQILSPSRPRTLEHNRQSRMLLLLNPPPPKNSWVEEAQKPSRGHAPPPAASTLL